MCEKYSPSKFDIRAPRGRKGWKVIEGQDTGPYDGTPIQLGWIRARADKSHRGGFHGFCFFFSRKDAEAYKAEEEKWKWMLKPLTVVPITVKGQIKRAKIAVWRTCYLAEYIKFDSLPPEPAVEILTPTPSPDGW